MLPRAAELGHDRSATVSDCCARFWHSGWAPRAIAAATGGSRWLPGSRPAPATCAARSRARPVQSRLLAGRSVPQAERSPDRLRAGTCGVCFWARSPWSDPTRWSRVRFPRSWPCDSRPRSGQTPKAAARRAAAAAWTRRPALGLFPQGRGGANSDPRRRQCRRPNRRQMVGGALLAVCGHDCLGPGARAIHPRPVR